MDDGILVIDSTNRKNGKYIFPRIVIHTLSFSKEENELLAADIKENFRIDFKLRNRSDGKNYGLELNKQSDILRFLDLVKPFVLKFPCMHYKISLPENMKLKLQELKNKNISVNTANLNPESANYTEE